MAGVLKSYGNAGINPDCVYILIIASDDTCNKLSKALHISSKKQNVNLQVNICNKIEDILNSHLHPQINFVVFGIDARNFNCLNEVKNNIKQLENFLKFGRVCFVNGYKVKHGEMAVSYNSIWKLTTSYNVHMLRGNVDLESKCLILADRILRLASCTVGAKTGIPFIHRPYRPKDTARKTNVSSNNESDSTI